MLHRISFLQYLERLREELHRVEVEVAQRDAAAAHEHDDSELVETADGSVNAHETAPIVHNTFVHVNEPNQV